jgi:hypothetical protein
MRMRSARSASFAAKLMDRWAKAVWFRSPNLVHSVIMLMLGTSIHEFGAATTKELVGATAKPWHDGV